MPIGYEDSTPLSITGDPPPQQPMSQRQIAGQQKAAANRTRQGPQPTGQPKSGGSVNASGQPEDKAKADQTDPGNQPKADVSQQPQQGMSEGRLGQAKLTPEQQQYYAKVAQNPWMPPVDFAEMGAEAAWNVAHHIGAGWNSLFDPHAQSVGTQQIWARQDAIGKLMQLAESGGNIAGVAQHQSDLAAGKNDPAWSAPATSEWFWQNFGTDVAQAPLLGNPAAWGGAMAASMAGGGPKNVQQVPGALAGGLPLSEIGMVAKHPEDIKDPAVAARLFWKSANAALLGFMVLPMGHWLRGFAKIDPQIMEELQNSTDRLKVWNLGDPSKAAPGELLKQALNLPPLPDKTLVASAAKRDLRTMENVGGEYIDQTSRQRAKIASALGFKSFDDLPHVAPNWTRAQIKLAKKVLPGWLPYDLTRQYAADMVPENPYNFLEQVPQEAQSTALNYLARFNQAHLQVLRGPLVDPLNAAESLTHSIPSTHTATHAILEQFHSWEAKLMEDAGVSGKDLMRAMRDPAAYDALAPAGKIIANTQKILRRVYADQSKLMGHREGFVPNYDPRIQMSEEAPIQSTTGKAKGAGQPLTSESKASRAEKFVASGDQIALAEKHPDVFALNAEMKQLRDDYVKELTKSGAIRDLEDKALASRDDFFGALRAQRELDRRAAAGPEPVSPEKLQAAIQKAIRRYPMFHEDLHEASLRSLEGQITALHSHIALQQAMNALAHDGERLAYHVADREIPAGYKGLQNASAAFHSYVFHPDFANPLNRISERISVSGAREVWNDLNQISVSALMFSPMIHGDNIAGRAAWILGKHPIEGSKQLAEIAAYSRPWSALESLFGVKPKSEYERAMWQLDRETHAMNAGMIPHFPSAKKLAGLIYSEYGKAIGDPTAFEQPGMRETWRLPPALHGIENAGRMVGNGYQSLQNLLWGRIVWPFGNFAFHVERAASQAAHPEWSDLVHDQYAAHLGNRWQGAIEPMARSAAMNELWKSLGFAISWVRSFYETALPSYLAKSAVAAHPEMRGFLLRQELQTLMGMMAAQHISGNMMNLLMSGHPQWENQPQNRYYIEVTRPDVIRGLQAMGLYKNIDPNTGVDPNTGGALVIENPLARQQLQNERMLGMEPGTTQIQGVQDMAAGHVAPILDTLLAAFNLNLPQSILAGTSRAINPAEGWGPHLDNVAATIEQFLGVSSTVGYQTQLDASGRPVNPSQMPSWLQNAPVPDVVKRYAAPAGQQVFNWLSGVRAPYVRAERTTGTAIPDQNYQTYDQLKSTYTQKMTTNSLALMQGKMIPYEWRNSYSQLAHDYAVGVSALFPASSSEYVNGGLGMYSQYQQLYNKSELPDGSGIDWAKLDSLQADFTQHLTATQLSDLDTQIAQHDNAYPALGMYRATINAHTVWANKFATDNGISYGTLMAQLDQARGLDSTTFRQFEGSHPHVAAYYAQEKQWEINTWPGRLYSLYYHTSSMASWLIRMEGSDTPAAEEKATVQAEQYYTPAVP